MSATRSVQLHWAPIVAVRGALEAVFGHRKPARAILVNSLSQQGDRWSGSCSIVVVRVDRREPEGLGSCASRPRRGAHVFPFTIPPIPISASSSRTHRATCVAPGCRVLPVAWRLLHGLDHPSTGAPSMKRSLLGQSRVDAERRRFHSGLSDQHRPAAAGLHRPRHALPSSRARRRRTGAAG